MTLGQNLLREKFVWVGGWWWWVGGGSKVSLVLGLVQQTIILALDLGLDQAEQYLYQGNTR